ncbi:MAG: LapA family protein, partial [Planctomycetota bacterium]
LSMKKFKTITIAVVIVLVLIVILQNTQSVETKFLFVRFSMPRAFLLMLTFMFGFIAGLLVTLRLEGKKPKKTQTD